MNLGVILHRICAHASCSLECLFSRNKLTFRSVRWTLRLMPECPSPLLERDILSKLHASVFMNMKPSFSLHLIEILEGGLMENLLVERNMLFL